MLRWFVVTSLLLPGAALAATVWTWLDANGQRHFSDRPVEGATRIEIESAQTFTPPSPPASARSGGSDSGEPQAPYETLRVASPEHTETLWNIEGTLDVLVEISPGLMPWHQIDLIVDGQRRYEPASRTSFTVDEIHRGVHSVQAVVLSGGTELMRSPATSFVVQQTSVLNPNNPNFAPRSNAGN